MVGPGLEGGRGAESVHLRDSPVERNSPPPLRRLPAASTASSVLLSRGSSARFFVRSRGRP